MSARFITPIFLHAGIIHILLNILAQLTASAEVYLILNNLDISELIRGQVEREMGSAGFLLLYLAAGIFGCV